jgi:hypothetical protein
MRVDGQNFFDGTVFQEGGSDSLFDGEDNTFRGLDSDGGGAELRWEFEAMDNDVVMSRGKIFYDGLIKNYVVSLVSISKSSKGRYAGCIYGGYICDVMGRVSNK